MATLKIIGPDWFADKINLNKLNIEEQIYFKSLTRSAIAVFNNDEDLELMFCFEVFKNVSHNAQMVGAILLTDNYQYEITYGQILKDLGKCVFMQIIKNDIIYKGRSEKLVGRIA